MGIFKNTKKRNIAIYSGCAIIVIASIVAICVVLWPKEEKNPELPKDKGQSQQQEQSDGPLYTIVPCEEVAHITGDSCDSETETPNYPTYTPTYNAPETTPSQTPQYNVPNVEPTPTYTPDCAVLHAKYYTTYQQKVSSARQSYNTGVSNASIQCSSNGSSQGGCTSLAERKLKAQLDSDISTYKSEYKQNMSSAGCDPSQYVDF